MAKGDKESTDPKTPKKKCVYKGCHQTNGLKKSKTGNWYCVAHHPDSKVKYQASVRLGQQKGAATKREARDAKLLTLTFEPNKAAILRNLILQANSLGKDIGPKELKRHRMLLELSDRIHDYATEEGDDAQKEQKVAAIMESDLPPELKLSKLTDVVGPAKACEMVKVVVKRNAYEDKVLDGERILSEEGKGGAATISKPQNFEVHESDETADLPPVEPGTVQSEPGAPFTAPGGGALMGPTPPPAEPTTTTETQDEKERRCVREAQELTGLYRAKCPTSPTPLEQIARAFMQGLLDGCPFKDLQARCLFPRSDTDQPMMMVRDILAAVAAKKKAAAG